MTLDAFFADHYLPHAKQHKRSWRRDEELYRLRIRGRFGSKRLDEITRLEVQQFHGEVRAGGLSPASADHHLKVLRHALSLAVAWELLDRNPVAGVKQFNADNRVEHLLDDGQLQRFAARAAHR